MSALSTRSLLVFGAGLFAFASACAAPVGDDAVATSETSAPLVPVGDAPTTSGVSIVCKALGADATMAAQRTGCGIEGDRADDAATCLTTSGKDIQGSLSCGSCTGSKPEVLCNVDKKETVKLGKAISLTYGGLDIVCPEGSAVGRTSRLSATAEKSTIEKKNGSGKDEAFTYYRRVFKVGTQSIDYALEGCTLVKGGGSVAVNVNCAESGATYATTASYGEVTCGAPAVADPTAQSK